MATEKRLIDANALSDLLDVEYKRKMKLVRKGGAHLDTLAEGLMSMSILLGTMPTVDAVEVVHGRWEWKPIQNKHWILTCSVCSGTKNASRDCNYCPNCGAKMDGDGNA